MIIVMLYAVGFGESSTEELAGKLQQFFDTEHIEYGIREFDYTDTEDDIPLSVGLYNRIYVDATKETDSNGNTIYGKYNIYNSNPNELTPSYKNFIISRIIRTCTVASGYRLTPIAATEYIQPGETVYLTIKPSTSTVPLYAFDWFTALNEAE